MAIDTLSAATQVNQCVPEAVIVTDASGFLDQMRSRLDDFLKLEAEKAGDDALQEAAGKLLDVMDRASCAVQSLRDSGREDVAQSLETEIENTKALVQQRNFAADSGIYELGTLSPHPKPSEASLREIAGGTSYIPEGTTSARLVRVAEMLAKMNLNGTRPLTTDGLVALGWSRGIGASGRVDYDPPPAVTLSANNALGRGLKIFKEYAMRHGLTTGIDTNRVELTPKTAEALLENFKHYAALSEVTDLDQKEMVLEALWSPVEGVYQAAKGTLIWTGEIYGSQTPHPFFSNETPLNRIERMRDQYGATHPGPVQLALSIRDHGINEVLNHVSEEYDASGRGRQMAAVVQAATLLVGAGSLGAGKVPVTAGKTAVFRLAPAGEGVSADSGAMMVTDSMITGMTRALHRPAPSIQGTHPLIESLLNRELAVTRQRSLASPEAMQEFARLKAALREKLLERTQAFLKENNASSIDDLSPAAQSALEARLTPLTQDHPTLLEMPAVKPDITEVAAPKTQAGIPTAVARSTPEVKGSSTWMEDILTRELQEAREQSLTDGLSMRAFAEMKASLRETILHMVQEFLRERGQTSIRDLPAAEQSVLEGRINDLIRERLRLHPAITPSRKAG